MTPAGASAPDDCASAPIPTSNAAGVINATPISHGVSRRGSGLLLLINRHAQDQGDRAGVGLALGTKTPRDLVIGLRSNHGPVALIVLTGASTPGHSAAAVVVGNDVVALIGGIAAGTDPGDRRHFGAGRTGIDAAAVAGTQRPIDRAIAPIIALGSVSGILRVSRGLRRRLSGIWIRRGRLGFRAARDRQQGQRRGTGQETSEYSKYTAPGGSAGETAQHFFR